MKSDENTLQTLAVNSDVLVHKSEIDANISDSEDRPLKRAKHEVSLKKSTSPSTMKPIHHTTQPSKSTRAEQSIYNFMINMKMEHHEGLAAFCTSASCVRSVVPMT
jgi:hypothetical protein